MAETSSEPGRLSDPKRDRRSLSYQLGLALTIALLPIGLLAAILAATNTRNARQAELLIAERQFRAVGAVVESIVNEPFLVLNTLLLRPAGNLPAENACTRDAARLASLGLKFESVAQIDSDGDLLCVSAAGARPSAADVAALMAEPPRADAVRDGLYWTGGESVYFAARSAGARGEVAFILAGVPAATLLARVDAAIPARTNYAVWIRGRQITGGNIPASAPGPEFKVIRTEYEGDKVIAAAGPLVLPELGLATLTSASALGASDLMPIVVPAAMWAAALLIAWLSVRRLVVGPLRQMAAGVRAYGNDDSTRISGRSGDADEIHAFAEVFDSMADEAAIARDKIAEALAAQQRLMREVHHRVKNNLQIVASLISIQAREAEGSDVARAYASIQMRVNALALVHRWLFEDNTSKGVDFGALAHDLFAGLQQSVAEAEQIDLAISTHIERLYVGQDAAVPLAFLITEIVAGAGQRAKTTPAKRATIDVRLGKSGNEGELDVASEVLRGTDTLSADARSPAARIVQGMVRQLRGTITYDAAKGRYCVLFSLYAMR